MAETVTNPEQNQKDGRRVQSRNRKQIHHAAQKENPDDPTKTTMNDTGRHLTSQTFRQNYGVSIFHATYVVSVNFMHELPNLQF